MQRGPAHEIMHYIESIVNAYPVEVLMMNDGSMEYSEFMDIEIRLAAHKGVNIVCKRSM